MTTRTLDGLDPTALVHELQVHQAELEVQNQELAAANDELRAVNVALLAARDRYRALYEVAPVALITIDPAGVVVDANRGAEALLRAPHVQLVGRRLVAFVDEGARAGVHDRLAELFVVGALREVEVAFEGAAGAVTEVRLDGVILQEPGAARAVLALVDVSVQQQLDAERRQLAQRAEAAQRLESLGTLAGGVAHDFNNLLTVITGGTELVLREFGEDRREVAPLLDVRLAARHAGELAQQMLAYVGQPSAPSRGIDVGELIRGTRPLLVAAARSTPVVIEVAPGLPPIAGVESQLRQVLLNLVINGAEAMRDRGGAIHVVATVDQRSADQLAHMTPGTALKPGPCLRLDVRDEGAGMDAETAARIFEPYFSTKFAGRGLGLAVVHGIVRSHGGALVVDSTLGVGTTFRIYLPLAPQLVIGPWPVANPDAAWRGAGRVLIVDDDTQVRRMIARLVDSFGCDIVTAGSGEEGLAALRDLGTRVDLVLTDLTMPGIGGVRFAEAVHALRPGLPIVLITGFGHVPTTADQIFAGRLTKPFDTDAFLALLQRFVPRATLA